MITIRKSPTADTRTCDFTKVSKETLLASSHQHIADVRGGLRYLESVLRKASENHDFDKITDIDGSPEILEKAFQNTVELLKRAAGENSMSEDVKNVLTDVIMRCLERNLEVALLKASYTHSEDIRQNKRELAEAEQAIAKYKSVRERAK